MQTKRNDKKCQDCLWENPDGKASVDIHHFGRVEPGNQEIFLLLTIFVRFEPHLTSSKVLPALLGRIVNTVLTCEVGLGEKSKIKIKTCAVRF